MATKETYLPSAAEILDQFYRAETAYMAASPEERDFASGMGATLAADLVLYQSPDLPYSQCIYHGHAGFQQWSQEMASLFSKLIVAEPKVFEREGADEVVVVSRLELTSRDSGKDIELPLVQIVGVDRKAGVITSMQPFYWNVDGLKRAVAT